MKKWLSFLLLALLIPAAGWCVGSVLTAGTYVAALSPVPTVQSASEIESNINSVSGVESARADPQKSTVQFTVEPGQQVNSSDIQVAVEKVNTDATLGTPQPIGTSSKPQ